MRKKAVKSKIVFGLSPSQNLAKKVARKLKYKYSNMNIIKFPDGEFSIKFPVEVKNKEIIIIQSLVDPNEKVLELLFIGNTAKELGAKKVTLIAPYLAYMRADRRFHKGEVISANILASLLSSCFDELLTIDPHLHRIKKLSDVFKIKAKRLTCVNLLGEFIDKTIKDPVIVGPDAESYQWANFVAKHIGAKAYVLKKRRLSSRNVIINVKGLDIKGKNVVIVDDIISTGHTMIETIKGIKKAKAKRIYCIGVHGLFVEKAYEKMIKAGANKIYTTNAIPHKNSKIDVAPLIVRAIKFNKLS